MTRPPRRNGLGPPVIVLGTALLLTALLPASSLSVTSAAAGHGKPQASPCPAAPVVAQAARQVGAASAGRIHFDPVIDGKGELTSQLLSVDTDSGPLATELPAESFVGRPVGGLIVYTGYSAAAGSSVHLVEVATGCDVIALLPPEVVRSALIAPDGTSLYVHSVTRGARRDNGVQRFDLATRSTTVVVPPMLPSSDFGPVFGTELRWSVDGRALAVQSCGFEACRTRVLDVASGIVSSFAAPGQGALIGLTKQHLITYGVCPGLPCTVLGIDLGTAQQTVLTSTAWSAVIVGSGDGGGMVTIETPAGVLEIPQ